MHKDAVFALIEDADVTPSSLPETFALDAQRIDTFRREFRYLSSAAAACMTSSHLVQTGGIMGVTRELAEV
jgi:T-complex protein 11